MTVAARNDAYTPSQISAVTGLSIQAVHKAIEHKLIRPLRVREGRVVRRLLSKSQAIYLRMEAKGLRSLPLAARHRVARTVETDPRIDSMFVSEGGVVLIEFKSSRKEVEAGIRRLTEATRMVEVDKEVMRGTPVYKGTRIPVHAVADMLSQGASCSEVLAGYPALTREKVELAPMYVKAFPRRGRPAIRPWARRPKDQGNKRRLAT
jgi:uncharacterized protein (DUF433 family)